MIRATLLAVSGLLAGACASQPPPSEPLAPAEVHREVVRETNYTMGEPVSATVGATLLRVREFVQRRDPGHKPGSAAVPVQTPMDVNFELLFSGQDASSIRLQYREYTADNLARAAFSQDLTYPRDATRLRFRAYEMEVVSLTADELRVRVVGEPPLPALD